MILAGWWWLEPWNFMTFHSVGNGKSFQLTLAYFSEGQVYHQPVVDFEK